MERSKKECKLFDYEYLNFSISFAYIRIAFMRSFSSTHADTKSCRFNLKIKIDLIMQNLHSSFFKVIF